MASELDTQADGRIAMAYLAGTETPWHAQETNPQIVHPGESIETWAEQSGTAYAVDIAPNERNGQPIQNSYHIARLDTDAVIGPYIAGQYIPVQNSVGWKLADILRDKYGFEIETAGALFGGSAIWIQLGTELQAEAGEGDIITSKPTINLNHSGAVANRFLSTNVRVVCNNTLTQAINTSDGVFKHDHRVHIDLDAVETALGLNAQAFGEFAKVAQSMAARALTDQEALDFFQLVIGGTEKQKDGKVIRSQGVRKAMAYYKGRDFIAEGKKEIVEEVNAKLNEIAKLPHDLTRPAPVNPGHDLASAHNTLWGAFNAVTWLADHKPVKNRGLEHQIASHALGDGNGGKVKTKAYKKALELLAA